MAWADLLHVHERGEEVIIRVDHIEAIIVSVREAKVHLRYGMAMVSPWWDRAWVGVEVRVGTAPGEGFDAIGIVVAAQARVLVSETLTTCGSG